MRPLLLFVSLAALACGYDHSPPDDSLEPPGSDAGRPGTGDGDGDGIAACDNGIDDDCDGLIDFAGGDPGCGSATDTSERSLSLICDDGIDNDGDGLVDFVDPACGTGGDPGCSSPTDTTEVDTPDPL